MIVSPGGGAITEVTSSVGDNPIAFERLDPSEGPINSCSDGNGGGGSNSKKSSSRRNAWGNLSYADLITQAIQSVPEKRLTLSQVYEWMVQNIPYFKDKGDSNSSAGWKVRKFLRYSYKDLPEKRYIQVTTCSSFLFSYFKDLACGKPISFFNELALNSFPNRYVRTGRSKLFGNEVFVQCSCSFSDL